MALVLADRVLETTTTAGSGTITLAGAKPGYQSFSVIGNGNTTYYTIALQGGTEWEVGLGTYTSSGTTLSRDTVLSSSDGGAKVTFSAGTKDVFVDYPAGKAVYANESGNISALSGKIVNLAEPESNSDATTKSYVDGLVSTGLYYHQPVQLATTTAFNSYSATYNNGTSGVSATITQSSSYTSLTIDGTGASVGNRILVKDATNQTWNGVYVVNDTGSGSTPWVLMRSTDADTYGPGAGDLSQNDYFFTQGGAANKGVAYVCNTSGTIVFGTTSITFTEFSTSQVYTAGTGISITNTTIALQTPVTAANGGTGNSSWTNNGIVYANSTTSLANSSGLVFDGTNLGIGGTTAATTKVLVSGNQPLSGSSGGVSFGVVNKGSVGTTGATGVAYGVYNELNAQASAVIQSYQHFRATQPSLAIGASVVTQYGFAVDATVAGAGSNYGFVSSIPPGAANFAFYDGGGAISAFSGNVGFKVATTISEAVHIGAGQKLRLDGGTSGYVTFKAPTAAGAQNYTLPSADGTTGQLLKTDGAGTLSWTTAGGGAQDFIVQSYGIV